MMTEEETALLNDLDRRVAKIERWIETLENGLRQLKEETERMWREYDEGKAKFK